MEFFFSWYQIQAYWMDVTVSRTFDDLQAILKPAFHFETLAKLFKLLAGNRRRQLKRFKSVDGSSTKYGSDKKRNGEYTKSPTQCWKVKTKYNVKISNMHRHFHYT